MNDVGPDGEPTADGFKKVELNVEDLKNGFDPPPVASFEVGPDGVVDMRDFRRFRDLYLIDHPEVANGIEWGREMAGFLNPARDVNMNSMYGPGSAQDPLELYSRGLLGAVRTADDDMPTGAPRVSGDASDGDLAVLKGVYQSGPGPADVWTAADLSSLLKSADLIIRATDWGRGSCNRGGFIRVSGRRHPDDDNVPQDMCPATVLAILPIPTDGSDLVVTTPCRQDVKVEAVEADGTPSFSSPLGDVMFTPAPGEDRLIHLNPACAILERLEQPSISIPLFIDAFATDLRNHDCTTRPLSCGDGTGGSGTAGSGGMGGSGGAGGTSGSGGSGGMKWTPIFGPGDKVDPAQP